MSSSSNFVLNWTDPSLPGKAPITLLPRVVDQTSTPLTLYGKGAPNYGQGLQENLLQMLENWCSPTAPGIATTGQLWFNTSTQMLMVYGSDNTWHTIKTDEILITAIKPANPSLGQLWFDASATRELYYYSGNNTWTPISAQQIVVPSTTAPTGSVKFLWADISTATLNTAPNIPILNFWNTAANPPVWQPISDIAALETHINNSNVHLSLYQHNLLQALQSSGIYPAGSSGTGDPTILNNLAAIAPTIVDVIDSTISKTGDTMTGPLILNYGSPTGSGTDLFAVSKGYVDTQITSLLQTIINPGATTTSIFSQYVQDFEAIVSPTQTSFSMTPDPGIVLTQLNSIAFIGGVKQLYGSVTFNGQDITLSAAATTALSKLTCLNFVFGGGLTSTNNIITSLAQSSVVATQGQTSFTTPQYEVGSNTLQVYVNGIKQVVGSAYSYTEVGTVGQNSTSILFNSSEIINAGHYVEFVVINFTGSTASIFTEVFIPTANTVGTYTVSVTPVYHYTTIASDLLNVTTTVYVNGIKQAPDSFLIQTGPSSVNITMLGSVNANDVVEVIVYKIA